MNFDNAAQAQEYYRALLETEPDNAQALAELGAHAGAAGRHDEAAKYLERACSLVPGNALYLHNFGESLRQLLQLQQAEAVFRKALAIDPAFAPAYKSLSEIALVAYRHAQQRQDAGEMARLAGEFSTLAIACGNLYQEAGAAPQAIEMFREILRILPEHAGALSNLGNALRLMGQITEAEMVCRKALAIRKDFPQAWNNLGNALVEQGRYAEAKSCFDNALALKPGFPEAIHNAGSGSLFNLLYSPELTLGAIESRHRQWGAAFALARARTSRALLEPGRRLRIAYLSADFRQHAMLHFIEPILACHDVQQFEVVCYAQGPARDEHTHRLMAYGHEWVWIHPLDDDALVKRIEDDGIDILVDCVGHTFGTRLRALARKPAPVMMSWLGYLAATGLPAMDYRLTDAWVDPPQQASPEGLEQVLRVPGGMMAYRPHHTFPDVADVPSTGNGHVTFGSLNNMQKFNPHVASSWAAILKRVPDSKLLMQSKFLVDHGMIGRVRGMFEVFGIGSERLDLRPYSPDFLQAYAEIDVALDTFPYGGGATTCDALWMGVPVITLSADRPCGRLSTSILNQIGHSEWIAASSASYVDLACHVAGNGELLKGIRSTLRNEMRASVLCDEAGFVRRLEQVYLTVATEYDSRAAMSSA